MRLRILVKVLIISLAIAMAGGTTMVWYSLQTKKAAGQSDAETKPILTDCACRGETVKKATDKNTNIVLIMKGFFPGFNAMSRLSRHRHQP